MDPSVDDDVKVEVKMICLQNVSVLGSVDTCPGVLAKPWEILIFRDSYCILLLRDSP